MNQKTVTEFGEHSYTAIHSPQLQQLKTFAKTYLDHGVSSYFLVSSFVTEKITKQPHPPSRKVPKNASIHSDSIHNGLPPLLQSLSTLIFTLHRP